MGHGPAKHFLPCHFVAATLTPLLSYQAKLFLAGWQLFLQSVGLWHGEPGMLEQQPQLTVQWDFY